MTYQMRLKNAPFLAIKSGRKTVELRLFDEKRSAIHEGDFIEFSNCDFEDTLLCRVKKLCVFPDFESLYKKYDKISMGYAENEVANPKDMSAYYSAEEIARYGVVAIEIEIEK